MELVFQKNNKEITTSQTVAKVFGKNHSKVLRDIRELGCSEEFSRANFGLVKTKDKKGEYRPSYEITKDGFTLLVMGYTGDKAMQFKEAYIKAFNDMAEHIRNYKEKRQDARLEYRPMTEKGKQIRDYFLECERQVKSSFQIPQTYSEALYFYFDIILLSF